MFCQSCGSQVESYMKFCPECGRLMEEREDFQNFQGSKAENEKPEPEIEKEAKTENIGNIGEKHAGEYPAGDSGYKQYGFNSSNDFNGPEATSSPNFNGGVTFPFTASVSNYRGTGTQAQESLQANMIHIVNADLSVQEQRKKFRSSRSLLIAGVSLAVLLVIAAVVCIYIYVMGKNGESGDFRGASWGMTKEEVIKQENFPLTAYEYEDGSLELYGYANNIRDFQGIELEFFYEFDETERLIFAGFTVTTEASSVTPQEYISVLEARYGKSVEITETTTEGTYSLYVFDGENSVVEVWAAGYEQYGQYTVWHHSIQYYRSQYPEYYEELKNSVSS